MGNPTTQIKQISVVIPALNERDGITRAIQAIPKAELESMGYEVEVLVVDNGSTDGSAELAKRAGATVIHEEKRGYGYAYKAGFSRAKGEIIATADADLTYPMEDLPRLLRMFENEGLDFLTTNRFAIIQKGAMSVQNRLGNGILSLAVRTLFRLKMTDPESGMWIFRKNILRNMRLGSNSWPFSHEIKLEACHFNKHHWQEVPIEYRPRVGKTKLLAGWKVGFTDLFHIIKKRFAR
jgi:glycosyltransferase involved in cell wall biosynthesis